MDSDFLINSEELAAATDTVIFDCRFSLADPDEGRRLYHQAHVPGACYLDLNRDLSGPVAEHGGRHPLPQPGTFAERLAACGVDRDTAVVAYDDNRLAFAARLWWMMRSLGYRPPRLLNGGLAAWRAAGLPLESEAPSPCPCPVPAVGDWSGLCDIDSLRQLQETGAALVDSREERRYLGLEEPVDPVAGHIPGALNRPWQNVTHEGGSLRDESAQRAHWNDLLDEQQLVVYCGSGVTACVNLFSLATLGRDDAILYGGSWSDWCSYL